MPLRNYLLTQGHGVIRLTDAIEVLCAQLTRDLFAIAKFLLSDEFSYVQYNNVKFIGVI